MSGSHPFALCFTRRSTWHGMRIRIQTLRRWSRWPLLAAQQVGFPTAAGPWQGLVPASIQLAYTGGDPLNWRDVASFQDEDDWTDNQADFTHAYWGMVALLGWAPPDRDMNVVNTLAEFGPAVGDDVEYHDAGAQLYANLAGLFFSDRQFLRVEGRPTSAIVRDSSAI